MIPDKIQIGPICYTLNYQDTILVDDDNEIMGEALGELNKIEQRITLSSKLHGTFQVAVLFHEIFHAIFEIGGLDDREGVMDQLSYAMMDLIRQNPNLIAYIQGEFK